MIQPKIEKNKNETNKHILKKRKISKIDHTPENIINVTKENQIDTEKNKKLKLKKEKKKSKNRSKENKEGKLEKKDKSISHSNTSIKTDKQDNNKEKVSQHPYQQPDPKDKSYKKAFYKEHKETTLLDATQINDFHKKNQMQISGTNCNYKPILEFSMTNFPINLSSYFSIYKKPTPIQSQCWPILISGRDIIGIAETGSGKTLAFALPGLIHILDQNNNNNNNPLMLVIAPTRELAMQSAEVITDVSKKVNMKVLCLYGGVPKHEQIKQLKNGIDIIVATPGRLKDLTESSHCNLGNISYLVLDEADRMLDDGFEHDIRFIISKTHKERQIAMFSATWPQSIIKLAHEFLIDPIKVTIGSEDLAASKNVSQIVEVIDERSKEEKIHKLLQKYHNSRTNRVLLFVLYKKEAMRIENMLKRRKWDCVAIHGDKSQYERTDAVNQFKTGSIPLLIATDVAARGLDIPDVEYVINYTFPLTIEDYVHRIGRTGRGGKKGIAHTFFTINDKIRAGELVNLLRDSNQTIPEDLLKFGTHVKKKEHKLYGVFTKDVDMTKKATKIKFDD